MAIVSELSLSQVFSSQLGVTRLLTRIMHGSLAPLLLLTPAALRSVDGIGQRRSAYVLRRVSQSGLRLRRDDERILDRARVLYGSLSDTPVQALMVTSIQSGQIVQGVFSPSPAIQLLLSINRDITIGDLHAILDDGLDGFLNQQGEMVDRRHCRDLKDELNSRILPWREEVGRELAPSV